MTNEHPRRGYRFESDEDVMRHALNLAERGRGRVEPNPMVGAVLINAQRELIADGFHAVFGGAHAEQDALVGAGDDAEGATLFVTLEPCAHHGKQPPCADAVIRANVGRVVCAMQDPFPQVAGRGINQIRAAGIPVEVGMLETEARRLNAPFLTRIATGRPYVLAKYAITLDGKMAAATGHSMWITGDESRSHVHRTRGRMDAILVGAGTAAIDNPRLTARPPGPRTPVRVVFDRDATRLLPTSVMAQTARETAVRLYHTRDATMESRRTLEECGVTLVEVSADETGRPSILEALQDLGSLDHSNVLLEGGATLLGRFRDCDAIDEYQVFIAPKVIGKGLSPMSGHSGGLKEIPEQAQVEVVEVAQSGADVAIRAIVPRPWLSPQSHSSLESTLLKGPE